MEKALGAYKNGNTIVSIMSDGTKIRYTPDGEDAHPEFPESIDLKITNMCDGNNGKLCEYCHEMSTPTGEHGCLNNPFLLTLEPYTEVAIGGGNPLCHPDLEAFLVRMKGRKVLCNMTVHWRQFEKNIDLLSNMMNDGLIHGLGVSVNEVIPCGVVNLFASFPNLVVHTIAGVASQEVYRQLMWRDLNLLILGFKTFGFGAGYLNNQMRENMTWLESRIKSVIEAFRAVSFDNLAIEQLKLKDKLAPSTWNHFFMGNEGEFTMYVDLVKEQFATSSTSYVRHDIMPDIRDMFAYIRKENGYA